MINDNHIHLYVVVNWAAYTNLDKTVVDYAIADLLNNQAVDNQTWMDNVTSEDYQKYYDGMYSK